MAHEVNTTRLIKMDPPIAFEFEGWPAILIAIGADTVVLHIEDEDHELAAAKLPPDIRRMAREQSSG